jgi:RNAse (barnase) inhibitor barstar
MKSLVLDGANFNTLANFYDNAFRVLAPALTDYVKGNLDGFNDILYGGYGAFHEDEKITLIWKNSDKSKQDLGDIFDKLVEIIQEHNDQITLVLK